VTKSEASKPLAGKISRCDRWWRLLARLSQANMASADRKSCTPTSERVKVCEISTQLSRIAVLVSAQLKSSVSVLASWVVRRGCVVQRRDKATKKAVEGARGAPFI
jgi:hypothetical protein